MPSAAEIDVDECAVPNVSYSLSSRRGKPAMGRPIAAGRPCRRGARSASCARTSDARRPTPGDRAACRRRSAAPPSARRCRDWTTDGRRSARPTAAERRAARRRARAAGSHRACAGPRGCRSFRAASPTHAGTRQALAHDATTTDSLRCHQCVRDAIQSASSIRRRAVAKPPSAACASARRASMRSLAADRPSSEA